MLWLVLAWCDGEAEEELHTKEQQAKAFPTSTITDLFASYENLNLLGDEFHQFRLQRLPHARLSTSQSMVNNFLHFLGSGGYYRQTGRAGGVSTPTMHKHANEVAEWISITANRHISLPTASEAPELVAGAIEEKEIIGFLDGFIMHIQRPAYARDAYYCGRPGKNVDGINVQYICDKNGKVCILIILRLSLIHI